MLSCVSFRVESFALRASSVNDILALLCYKTQPRAMRAPAGSRRNEESQSEGKITRQVVGSKKGHNEIELRLRAMTVQNSQALPQSRG